MYFCLNSRTTFHNFSIVNNLKLLSILLTSFHQGIKRTPSNNAGIQIQLLVLSCIALR